MNEDDVQDDATVSVSNDVVIEQNTTEISYETNATSNLTIPPPPTNPPPIEQKMDENAQARDGCASKCCDCCVDCCTSCCVPVCLVICFGIFCCGCCTNKPLPMM